MMRYKNAMTTVAGRWLRLRARRTWLAVAGALGALMACQPAALGIGADDTQSARISFGPRGEVTGIADGKTVYFSSMGIRVIRPGWSGAIVDQTAGEPGLVQVRRSRSGTVYEMSLTGDGVTFRITQTVRAIADGQRISYALTVDRDTPVETVMLFGVLPLEPHAGRTRLIRSSGSLTEEKCPAKLPANYILFSGPADWMALAAPGARPVVLEPAGMTLQFQDDRKFDVKQFTLLGNAAAGILKADKPIKFDMTIRFLSSQELAARIKEARRNDVAGLAVGDRRKLGIGSVTLDRSTLRTYETVEAAVNISATYSNPFDPDEIRVEAEIAAPGGRRLRVPGFFGAPMQVERVGASERLRVAGTAGFRVRYTPAVAGEHTIVVVATDRTGTVRSKPVKLTVTRGTSPGFVRRSAKAPAYFAFDNGAPFIAIGENVCWASDPTPIETYSKWFKGLGAAGGNWARLWLAYNEKGLEWSAAPTPRPGTGTYGGLGRYALDNAWRLDEIIRIAERNGIYLMLCLGTYGEFTQGGFFNEGMWVSNPYNKANGGPCAEPADFWTNAEARRAYKKRLRYLIARYGHSPHVFAWEFWNEVPPTNEQAAWVAEMAAYLKENDPYGHLVSTTYGNDTVWKCPNVDFTMTHMYGQAGNTPVFTEQIVAHTRDHRRFEKPYILAEFGIDWQAPDTRWDPKASGINMHNGLWSGLLAGGAGTAMVWWWDSYVHPGDLYRLFRPVRKFADAVDWQAELLKPVDGIVVQTAPDAPETFKDLTVAGSIAWGLPPSDRYTVMHDGSVRGGPIAMAIGSPTRSTTRELPTKLTWVVDLERPTTVTLRLGQVCTRARMVVKVNGETRLERELTAGEPGAGPWKSSKKLEQYDVWVADYDEDIPIELPAGPHEIEVSNTDGDWFQIASLTLPGYQSSRYPDVTALALAGERTLLMWLHNRESSWRTDFDGKKPTTLGGLRVSVPVGRSGQWDVEWWDTWTGEIIRREAVEALDGALRLLPPPLERDFAVRATRR